MLNFGTGSSRELFSLHLGHAHTQRILKERGNLVNKSQSRRTRRRELIMDAMRVSCEGEKSGEFCKNKRYDEKNLHCIWYSYLPDLFVVGFCFILLPGSIWDRQPFLRWSSLGELPEEVIKTSQKTRWTHTQIYSHPS